jgi:hypothetical protein
MRRSKLIYAVPASHPKQARKTHLYGDARWLEEPRAGYFEAAERAADGGVAKVRLIVGRLALLPLEALRLVRTLAQGVCSGCPGP